MSDLLFSIGADDREFQRALSRVEGSSERTARHTESLLSLHIFKHAAKEAIQIGQEALEAYAKTSDYARQRVEALREEHDKLFASLGRDLTYVLGSGAGGKGVSGYLQDASDYSAAFFHDYIKMALDLSQGQQIDYSESYFAKRGAMDDLEAQDKRIEQDKKYLEEHKKLEMELRKSGGNEFDAKRADEETKHDAILKEIGGLKAASDKVYELREMERKRHEEALHAIDREAEAKQQKLIEEEDKQNRLAQIKMEQYQTTLEQLDIESRLSGSGKDKAERDQLDLQYRQKIVELYRDELLTGEQKRQIEQGLLEAESNAMTALIQRQHLEEQKSRRFDVLEQGSVYGAATRRQVLGGAQYQPADPGVTAAIQTAEATRKAAESARRQEDLLRSIDRSIAGAGGNVARFN